MAKYEKYAEYQDSGVEWLGDIPSHWKVSKIGFHTSKIGSGKTPKGGSEIYQDEGILFLRSQNIYNDGLKIEESESVYITEIIHEDMSTSKVLSGDILLNITGGSIGRSCLVPSNFPEANVNQHVCIIRVQNYLNEFLSLVIKADLIQSQIKLIQTGGNREGLNFEQISKFVFMLPPKEEQKLIVDFLDHETAKIDSLIAKQEKLIELLKEKRQAVISHAVTKGLNPNVTMKDSGVEWLGQVPEHWEIRQLRYLGACQNGINIGAEYFGSGSPFISYGDVYRNHELPTSFEGLVQSTDNDRRIYSVQRGDVLFTRTSETIEEIGFSSTCLRDVEDATFAGFLIRFRPIPNTLLPEYSKFYFRNILLRAFFVKEMNLVTRASLSQELLKKLAVPFPNLDEQKQIADFLSAKELVFEKLINDCVKQIELLKERRTALISSAVTGKIDVRNWQAPHKNNKANTEKVA